MGEGWTLLETSQIQYVFDFDLFVARLETHSGYQIFHGLLFPFQLCDPIEDSNSQSEKGGSAAKSTYCL